MKQIPHAPQRISHAEGVFHARSAFHKSRKGFISLKKALAYASAFFYGVSSGSRTHDLQGHNLAL